MYTTDMDPNVIMSGQGLAILALLGAYLLTTQYLRFQRRNRIKSAFADRPLSSMTVHEAHEIMRELRELEFPHTNPNPLIQPHRNNPFDNPPQEARIIHRLQLHQPSTNLPR